DRSTPGKAPKGRSIEDPGKTLMRFSSRRERLERSVEADGSGMGPRARPSSQSFS
uniref:Uncharacterized protein n=1 Tax=Cannabis sativa TaxID=3483 RepID=A0A803QSW8_CANSA